MSSDLEKATSIAVATLRGKTETPDHYRLIAAQRIFQEGELLWRVTFKLERLLPKDSSKQIMGLGGEIFVNVDLGTGKSEVTYGE